MTCAVFALAGVIIGAAVALYSCGRIVPKMRCEKRRTQESVSANGENGGDKQIMKQWQNLLSYGTQNNANAQ